MGCVVPKVRWSDGFRRPVNIALMTAGVAIVVTGVIARDGWWGVGQYGGGLLFLLGASNGRLSAQQLGSVFQLVGGAARRRDELVRACEAQNAKVRAVAEAMLEDAVSVQRTSALAVSDVSEQWPTGIDVRFRRFLLCRTIATARSQDEIYGDGRDVGGASGAGHSGAESLV